MSGCRTRWKARRRFPPLDPCRHDGRRRRFLGCTVLWIFQHAPPIALDIVAWTGGITAIFAATIAVAANDVKKVLAYSTISQLGYMIMGLGVGGYSAGLFHLTTHAAFKALLFLGAGSIIHAAHTNDIWKMGSLSKQMPTTCWTFLMGTLALVGFYGTSGYFSKEMILGAAYGSHHYLLYAIGCAGAFLTSFYMTRAFSLVFLGGRARTRSFCACA